MESNTRGRRRDTATSRALDKQRRRKKKKRPNPILLIIALGAIMMILAIATLLNRRKHTDGNFIQTATEEMVETALTSSVMIDDIDITGMSKEEARNAVLAKYTWNMKAVYGTEEYAINNLIGEELDTILNEIFTGEAKESYQIVFTGLDELIAKEVENIAQKWNKKAKNAGLVGFDAATSTYSYADGENGVEVDVEKLKSDIAKAIESKDFSASISVTANVTKPEIATKEDVKSLYKVIGTFTTKTTSNKDRNTNIEIATKALDGKILAVGEEFSFNNTTGNRTTDKGYRPAGAYVNGVLVEEPGGGVCQVSSTLYNAVVFSGLTTTERHAHSYEPSYVTPGEDAMVSYDGYAGPDMKFVNNSQAPVVLRAKFSDQTLTISIVGLTILAEDEKVYMTSHKVSDYDAPEPTYVEDTTLTPGTEVTATQAKLGSRWVTNLVKTKAGAVVSDEFLHNSTYRGKPATIKRNTSGVQETVESAESTTTAETTKAVDGTKRAETVKAVESTKQAETVKGPESTKAAETTKSAAVEVVAPNPTVIEQQGPGGAGPMVETVAPNPGN